MAFLIWVQTVHIGFPHLLTSAKFLELIFRNSFLLRHISKNIQMEIIQKYLRQLLPTVPTSKMLQVPLCLDALFEHFKQRANNSSPRC